METQAFILDEQNSEDMITELLQFGRSLTLSGTDIRIVEKTLEHLGKHFGACEMNVFVISAAIIVTACFDDGLAKTQSIRISEKIGYDFVKVEKLTALADRALKNEMTIAQFKDERKKIDATGQSRTVAYLGSCLAAGGFAIFFGGALIDGVIAALVGLLFCLMQRTIRPYCPNDIVFNYIACLISGLCITFLGVIIPNLMLDMITIGVIMLPIPGIPITNAVRDMISGDIITGILRFVESLLITVGIAAGFISALALVGA